MDWFRSDRTNRDVMFIRTPKIPKLSNSVVLPSIRCAFGGTETCSRAYWAHTQRPGDSHTRPMASTIGTMRALLQEGGAAPSAEGGDDTLPVYKVSCAECEALSHPAVVASDWIGFIALGFSAFILIFKLRGFRGPNQDDKYYFGSVPQPNHSHATGHAHLSEPRRRARGGGEAWGFGGRTLFSAMQAIQLVRSFGRTA